ncbi:MAG: hypothetical protein NWT08_01905 [Akkermansiaceae bacterium]|jgi:hypothetical protein|nr:hypothetical protein [Akkermansiaceae bacterium]MDP4645531.1 hypothetical protein [Akkermansiaceae bacterium]MDP4721888.1 hypothetical protein [Akkermansiaceae bacterium]MDP4778653.1 hypothetical protein [Akkermansiaceae bacterium]MDP4847802.1 hypothetical protein [Akkermansiaceae bacterium]
MKHIISTFFFALATSTVQASEVILPYSAFGPQVAAYELIGMEWWQWDSHGDGTEREYPIKVVVFWDQTLEETSRNHPVDQEKQQDFRYVEYAKAVEHMAKTIKEFKEVELDASDIEQALAKLKTSKAREEK